MPTALARKRNLHSISNELVERVDSDERQQHSFGMLRIRSLANQVIRTMTEIRTAPILLSLLLCIMAPNPMAAPWSPSELSLLRLQWLGSLPPLAPNPSNHVSDNPRAAEFGQRLFFDRRLSVNGEIACASCHIPNKSFTDGLAKSRGVGVAKRSAPTVIGAAYAPWYFWDGRSDSLWSQALDPLESPVEHGSNRLRYAKLLHDDPVYRDLYETLFGPLPDLSDQKRFPDKASPVGSAAAINEWRSMVENDRRAVTRVFVNIGKAIAAYQRKLIPGFSRFDHYLEKVFQGDPSGGEQLSTDEIAGLKLFVGKAMCVTCHMGPLFTNYGFHNIGAPDPDMSKPRYRLPIVHLFVEKPEPDMGRYRGVRQSLVSEFNCLGEYSDAVKSDCSELVFANTRHQDTLGAFKVPTLRNIADTAPYMHVGQFATLGEVLRHYNDPPVAPSGRSELIPLALTERELNQLEAFLHSLSSPPSVSAEWLRAPDL